ncbi:MAG: ribosomal protein [Myxococcaceae bacterium]|jgi:small subunit ribosomal protein S16|nr:ribosomal protein [Myxococcaceae bacterium]
MAVHIRLSRAGAKKRPFYRLMVTDHRSPRGGKFLENIGTYDPSKDPGLFTIDQARLDFWRGRGATPSETVDRLLKKHAKTAAVASPDAAAEAPKKSAKKSAKK